MFLQKMLFRAVTVISKAFRLGSSWTPHTNEKGETIESGSMLYDRGPRIAVLRTDGEFRLTGIFAINFVRVKDGRCISCKPFVFTIEKGHKVYFGNAAQEKCREIYPPLPKDHVPMFQDGDGCSFG
jgi:hypothetical protein